MLEKPVTFYWMDDFKGSLVLLLRFQTRQGARIQVRRLIDFMKREGFKSRVSYFGDEPNSGTFQVELTIAAKGRERELASLIQPPYSNRGVT